MNTENPAIISVSVVQDPNSFDVDPSVKSVPLPCLAFMTPESNAIVIGHAVSLLYFRDDESRASRSERSTWRRERCHDDSLVIYGRHRQWPCAHGGFYNDPDFEPTPDPTLQEFPG